VAAKNAPILEDVLEEAMFSCLSQEEPITKDISLLVDISGSMRSSISDKSNVLRIDVASSLAILLREVCKNIHLYSFNAFLSTVPPRRGFALSEAIISSMGGATRMWGSIREVGKSRHSDVMIVITDEQTEDSGDYHDTNADLLVIVNIASSVNGVNYDKNIIHINGWSDTIVKYLQEYIKKYYS
jgi:hypothetical protein